MPLVDSYIEDVLKAAKRLGAALEEGVMEDAIEQLEALEQVPMTVHMLKETKIGPSMSKWAKHADERVSSRAKKLLASWKSVAEQAGVKSRAAATMPSGGAPPHRVPASPSMLSRESSSASTTSLGTAGSGSGEASATAATAPDVAPLQPPLLSSEAGGSIASVASNDAAASIGVGGAPSGSGASAAARTSAAATGDDAEEGGGGSTPVVDAVATAAALAALEPKRQNIVKAMSDMLFKVLSGSEELRAEQSEADIRTQCTSAMIALEHALHIKSRTAPSITAAYSDGFKTLMFGMPKNFGLCMRFYCGRIDCKDLISMTSDDLASEDVKREREEAIKRYSESTMLDWKQKNQKKIMAAMGLSTSEGFTKCSRCKSTDTDYHEVQTRSADEPTTKKAWCNACGHRWRFF